MSEPLAGLVPVGRVVGGRDRPEDDDWGAVRAVIRPDDLRFGPQALAGLAEFSHLEACSSSTVPTRPRP